MSHQSTYTWLQVNNILENTLAYLFQDMTEYGNKVKLASLKILFSNIYIIFLQFSLISRHLRTMRYYCTPLITVPLKDMHSAVA